MTYWGNDGEQQAAYDKLWSELVPPEGACTTIEGECLRAISRIYYDFYNNGFGNNWSGAFNWLIRHGFIIGKEISLLIPYRHGDMNYRGNFEDDDIVLTLENITNRIVTDIASKNGVYRENKEDMFAYDDKRSPRLPDWLTDDD